MCRSLPTRGSGQPGPPSGTRSPPPGSRSATTPTPTHAGNAGRVPSRRRPASMRPPPPRHREHVEEHDEEQDLEPELGPVRGAQAPEREQRRAGDLRSRDDGQVEIEPRDLHVGERSGRRPRRGHTAPRTARGIDRFGSFVSSARLAAVSNPTKISTPYRTPKRIPGESVRLGRRIERLREVVVAPQLDDHRDGEDQHHGDRDEREGELHPRRDLHPEVQNDEQQDGARSRPRPRSGTTARPRSPGAGCRGRIRRGARRDRPSGSIVPP